MQRLYSRVRQYIQYLRERCIAYTHTRYAEGILYAIAFTESFIFPIPPDVLLLPMVFARKAYAWRYALGTTLASLLGGMIGYAIGFFFFSSLGMWVIEVYSLQSIYTTAQVWFEKYGVITMLVAGLTPLPYKLATILAGMFSFNFPLFILSSFIGRGIRFFALGLLPHLADTKLGQKMQKNIGITLFFMLVFLVGAVILYSSLTGR